MTKTKGRTRAQRAAIKAARKSIAPAKTEAITVEHRPLPTAWQLTRQTAQLLWQHKKLLGGIVLVYGLLNVILVQSYATTDVGNLKTALHQVFHGQFADLASGLTVFAVLVGASGSSASPGGSSYQAVLLIVVSLALIWALRNVFNDTAVRIRDAYYQGMYPLAAFTLVLLMIGIQLIPLAIGAGLYSAVITNGIAVHAIEQIIWLAIFLALAWWSLYLIMASTFALYIVTLPDMTPLKALRSAKQLVSNRRLIVFRKVLWLVLALLITAVIIMLPIILWLTPLTAFVFFLLGLVAIAVVHSYLYSVYRGLLNE